MTSLMILRRMVLALARPVATRKLPVVRRHVSIGFLTMLFWVISLYGIAIGVWWVPLRDCFIHRNDVAGIGVGSSRLAAIALTGHLCDITMGMVLLPISRHSALASFFQLSTTLTNRALTAYTLFVLVIIHGCLYVSWVPAFDSLSAQLRKVIPILNPTYLYTQVWPGDTSSIGIWRASMIFSGSFAALIMCAIAITTLPKVRRANFNLFYFTHLLAILMVIVICLLSSIFDLPVFSMNFSASPSATLCSALTLSKSSTTASLHLRNGMVVLGEPFF